MDKRRSIIGVLLAAMVFACAGNASEVVQIDVRSLLNSRPVTTLKGTKLNTWSRGVDGEGVADGFLTREAALYVGDRGLNALPGDGFFPANDVHPQVMLNFSNADGNGAQTLNNAGASTFRFKVPAHEYVRMMLFMTSAEGPSKLSITLSYADGSQEVRRKQLPDYYNAPPAEETDFFVLAGGLAKWNASNRMAEANHHYIHGLDLKPNEAKKLVGVRVEKTQPGYLVF